MQIEAFNDVKSQPMPEAQNMFGQTYLGNVNSISIGTGSKVFRGDESGIWLGSDKFVDAPFSVDMEGTIVASSLVIVSTNIATGAVTTSKIAAGAVTATEISAGSITTSKIAANAITATQISANAITATQIAADAVTSGKISVDTLDAIAVNMGILTAGTINGGYITTGGVQIVGNGMIMGNNKLIAFYTDNGILAGAVYMDTSNTMNFGNNNRNIDMLTGSGNFKVNGTTKTAIVSTEEGYKALYCIESPEVWFMDFCYNKDTIDPIFLEVTEGSMKFIKCDDGSFQVWRRRKGFGTIRLEAKTKNESITNTQFWDKPKEKAMQNQFAISRAESDTLRQNIHKLCEKNNKRIRDKGNSLLE